MAANAVTGDQYRSVDRKLREIMRQLDQDGGYPFDLGKLDKHLQAAIEGKFGARARKASDLCSLAEAAEILGSDFHPLEVAEKFFGITLGDNDRALYQSATCPREVVYQMKGKAVLTPTLSLSLMDSFNVPGAKFHSDHRPNPWFENNQSFAREVARPVIYTFVGKAVKSGSVRVHWDTQQDMVTEPEFIPSTAVVAQAATLHYELTDEKMFEHYWARTSDASHKGNRVYVRFVHGGFYVDYWRARAHSVVGVSWARQFG